MPLDESTVQNAKSTTKSARLFDSRGLYLEVSPAGGKLWRLKYRFGGKQNSLALGAYPTVGLDDARKARDDARHLRTGDRPGKSAAPRKGPRIDGESGWTWRVNRKGFRIYRWDRGNLERPRCNVPNC